MLQAIREAQRLIKMIQALTLDLEAASLRTARNCGEWGCSQLT